MTDSALVGSIFILIGELAVSIALCYLFFRVKWFIPQQGSGTSDYTTPIKKAIPIALGVASLIAKIVGFGLDTWDEWTLTFFTFKFTGKFGLLTFRSSDMQINSMGYGTLCNGETFPDAHGSTCNMMQLGAILTLIVGTAALAFTLFVLGNTVVFYRKPELMQARIFLVWRASAVGWVVTVAAANVWGGVAHLCLSSMVSTRVSWSYNAFNASFFLDWFLYLFMFFAVKNTPAVGAEARQSLNALPASDASEAQLHASQDRVRELEHELSLRDLRADPNSRMLHPSIPVAMPVAQPQPVYAMPLAAAGPPGGPGSSYYAVPPSDAVHAQPVAPYQDPTQNQAFFSAYQPPKPM